MIPYEDDDDAVRIANDSHYGLAGFVAPTTSSVTGVGSPGSAGTIS